MILQALLALAERDNLGDSDFDQVGVRWLVPITTPGRLAGNPIPVAEDLSARRPVPKKMWRPYTSPNELNQGDKSHFLCDSLERATLYLNAKSSPARAKQHAYFKSLLSRAGTSCPADAARLQAVVAVLDNSAQLAQLHRGLEAAGAKPTDNAAFVVDGLSLLDSPSLKQYWRRLRAGAAAKTARPRRVCLATGGLEEILDTHEKIKGVPGANATGANLISFDKDSFCSFGLAQAQNAPLSAPAELKIRSALNALIEKSRSQGLVFGDSVFLHWSREAMEFDPVEALASAEPEAVARLLESVRSGRTAAGLDAGAYYAMALSGNGARIVVRDWLASTVPEVAAHIAQWFGDLALVEPDGSTVHADRKLFALFAALVPSRRGKPDWDKLPPQFPSALLRAAISGAPIADAVLAATVRRQQLEANKAEPARLALVKACLTRASRLGQPKEKPPVTELLDLESENPAYLCGRLFAVLERLQYLALRSVNAGIAERYYASACSTPALVMGRLLRNAQFHLAKAAGGAAENVRKEIEIIALGLGGAFPQTLDLEGQGRFALGYYHQRADARRRSAERKEQAAAAEAR